MAFSSLSDINTTFKIGITITLSFTLCYIIAIISLWCWNKMSFNDVTSISIRNWSISQCKFNKKPIPLQYRVPTRTTFKFPLIIYQYTYFFIKMLGCWVFWTFWYDKTKIDTNPKKQICNRNPDFLSSWPMCSKTLVRLLAWKLKQKIKFRPAILKT